MKFLLSLICTFASLCATAQNSWTLCNAPNFRSRVDDVFMVNTQTGYAVCGDGQIVKTTDEGNNWNLLLQDSTIYCRSVEFFDTQTGFVGAFSHTVTSNILRKTTDGGATWTDLTTALNPKARKGICGLAIADASTVYGCGNWFQDSSYIVKSVDGGTTWSFIDMSAYATSLIDMHFIDKDTGFVTGKGPAPNETAVILYTTDGGGSWTYKFQHNVNNEYCWKIQHLTDQLYFASIECFTNVPSTVLKSTDGGMNWTPITVVSFNDNLEGIGFIDSLLGWTGGGPGNSYETTDGGLTWTPISICPSMNRVFRVNSNLLFASGDDIWKYGDPASGISPSLSDKSFYTKINCYPNPADANITIEITLLHATRLLLLLFDDTGKETGQLENAEKPAGTYRYTFDTKNLPAGIYHLALRTHEDKQSAKIVVKH